MTADNILSPDYYPDYATEDIPTQIREGFP